GQLSEAVPRCSTAALGFLGLRDPPPSPVSTHCTLIPCAVQEVEDMAGHVRDRGGRRESLRRGGSSNVRCAGENQLPLRSPSPPVVTLQVPVGGSHGEAAPLQLALPSGRAAGRRACAAKASGGGRAQGRDHQSGRGRERPWRGGVQLLGGASRGRDDRGAARRQPLHGALLRCSVVSSATCYCNASSNVHMRSTLASSMSCVSWSFS
ncbi:hypothetical protein MUK42_19473, partial [Musa troglodytarum]